MNTNNEPFAQIPHSVILANIPDKLKLLLCYCYSNAPVFRYNVPEASDFLQCDRRTTQRHFRALIAAGVLTATTSFKVKHGEIPNYSFNAKEVSGFIKSQPRRIVSGVEAATEPPTEPATRPPTEPPTPDHTNNINNQEEEPKRENQENTNGGTRGIALRPSPPQGADAGLHGRDLGQSFEDYFWDRAPIPSTSPPADTLKTENEIQPVASVPATFNPPQRGSLNVGAINNNAGHPGLASVFPSTPASGGTENSGGTRGLNLDAGRCLTFALAKKAQRATRGWED